MSALTKVSLPLGGLLREIEIPMLVIDREGCVSWINDAFESVFGWPREQIVDVPPPLPIWAPEDVAWKTSFWETVLSGAPIAEGRRRLEYAARTASGETYRCAVVCEEVEDVESGTSAMLCAIAPLVVAPRAPARFRELHRRDQLLQRLSPREREVVALLLDGLRVPAIAQRLHVSQHTVRNHLKASYRKLGIGSQVGLLTLVSSED